MTNNHRSHLLAHCSVAIVVVARLASSGLCLDLPGDADPVGRRPVVAWFTDAELPGAARRGPAEGAASLWTRGNDGHGVAPARGVAIENPSLRRDQGLLSFWLKPNWNGDDGKTHRLLRLGDPAVNGLFIEKSNRNTLRFVMASPTKTTSARCDVSRWRAGEWHCVTAVWRSLSGKPLGTTLFLDEPAPGRGGPLAVHGPVASGSTFLDPEAMDDARVWIGDASSDAVIDELIMRSELRTKLSQSLPALVYRDYFRTAPYERIAIDPQPHCVRADRRVIAGQVKQFGLKGLLNGEWRRLTDFTARYGQWGEHDAKPFIAWTTADGRVAAVDNNGLVTGVGPGRCTLTARFRGMSATYPVEVLSVERPDLDLAWLSRLRRYRAEAPKNKPGPGEPVVTQATVANYGFVDVPAGTDLRFELIPDRNRNYVLDGNETPRLTRTRTILQPLSPREKLEVNFTWRWTDEPLWVRVTLDPDDRLPELCEANNERHHLNIARPNRFGIDRTRLAEYHAERKINLVGSFSYFDYAQATVDRFELMLRESVYPTTSPVGVGDSVYVDMLYELDQDKWRQSEYEAHRHYFDGGYPDMEEHLLTMNSGLIHELGHTVGALPDLYNYGLQKDSVFVTNGGRLCAGTELMPELNQWGTVAAPVSRAACGPFYSPLMDHCHLWLHPANAGKMDYYRGYRGERFWGSQGRLLPTWENALVLYDLDDGPLVNAALYVYQVSHADHWKFVGNRPKFLGHTDEGGRFVFPRKTDQDWDDGRTDEVEGAIPVWNPFGQAQDDDRMRDVPFTSNVWETEGVLLVKIVSDGRTEFHWLIDLDFQVAFFSGQQVAARIPIRTSLRSSPWPVALVRPPILEAISQQNRRPVAVIEPKEVSAKFGETVTLDASDSTDPEGQPLFFRWQTAKPDPDNPATATIKAPHEARNIEAKLWVCDGVRGSDAVTAKIVVSSARS